MTQESVQKLSPGPDRFSILLRPTHQNTSNDMIAASFREKNILKKWHKIKITLKIKLGKEDCSL